MRPLIRARRVVLPLAALALAGTGMAAYGAVGEDSGNYRTVTATTGSVEQELSLSGTISPSGSSELAFGTGGTVAKVRVEQGDEVDEGDVIAVLDRSSLQAAVDRAASDLASAKAQLAADRDAQTSAVAATTARSSSGASSVPSSVPSSGTSPRTGSASGSSDSSPSGASAAVVKQLTAQQDAVLEAQTTAGTALSAADTALADQQAACADPVTTTESTDAATDAATDSATADAGTTTPTAVLSEECTSALAAVQSAQATAADAQTALQAALATLGSTLTDALGSVQVGPSTGSSGGGGSTASGGTPSGSGSTDTSAAAPSGGSTGGQPVTAATLAQDQASIDRAKADLAAAKADLAGAVVRASADGTVVSLAVTAADDVAAGDTVAVVVAPGLTTVTIEATATQASQLEQGGDVEVTPAGATEALAGAVSRVEHVPSSDATTGSDPTYTVEVVLDERGLQLADGMPASVTAVVGAVDDVVVVPASAVSNGSVTVVENGVAQRVRVATGVVGATQIEITDGLEDGEVVVLADLDADLPSGDSEQQGGFGGGFGGGGFPAGGRPGGGRPAR